jgi:hypothetical protein
VSLASGAAVSGRAGGRTVVSKAESLQGGP